MIAPISLVGVEDINFIIGRNFVKRDIDINIAYV
jgi:hypothetical protein